MSVPDEPPLGVAVIGAGYWGPNLIRNFAAAPMTSVRWVCDPDTDRAQRAAAMAPKAHVGSSLEDALADDQVQAVAIATPPETHSDLAREALRAGRHVWVEKPLADSTGAGEAILAEADERGLVLLVDHTFCYTQAVRRIQTLLAAGELGRVYYYDSVRINLGLVQSAVDVFWDLAPHDLSILDFVLPGGCVPSTVAAQAADPLGVGHPCVGYLTLTFPDGLIGHFHVNWLSPTKIRTVTIGGSDRMLVYNDLNPAQPVSVFESGVDRLDSERADPDGDRQIQVSYRIGDMYAPALQPVEALSEVVREFAGAIAEDRRPLTDGRAGLRVLAVLEAAQESLAAGGVPVEAGSVPEKVPS